MCIRDRCHTYDECRRTPPRGWRDETVTGCRRLGVRASIAALALLASLSCAVEHAGGASNGDAASSWTVYHGDAAGTGVSTAVTSIDTGDRVWTCLLYTSRCV